MPPSTRSGGVPAPERVYHSTPSLHQVRFPARRAAVKTYGKKTRKPVATNQSTLTQLNWVSSSNAENAVVEFSDSEEEKDKENEEEEEDEEEPVTGRRRQRRQAAKQTFFEDDPPSAGKRRRGSSAAVQKSESKSKRRRTLGDEIPENARRAPSRGRAAEKVRRKTMDDMPSPEDSKKKKMYHTQTITQVVRGFNQHVIGDSEDDEEEAEGQRERDGFDEWVGAPSPSPKGQKQQPPYQRPEPEDEAPPEPREDSVVPQTPAKKQIRFEIPSSTQSSKSHLSARALERYGPIDQPQVTPSKGGSSAKMEPISELPGDASRRKAKPASARKLVIEDSFAEDSWGSTQSRRSPLKDVTAAHVPLDALEEEQGEGEQDTGDEQVTPRATPRPSSSLSKESSSVEEAMSTPSKPPHRRRGGSKDLGRESPSPQKTPRPQQASASSSVPGKKDLRNVVEIPDSEEEDDEDGDDDYWGEEQVKTQDQRSHQTQQEQAEEPKSGTQLEDALVAESAAPEQQEADASEEPTRAAPTQNQDTFVLGAETQGAFDELTMSLDTTPKTRAPLSTLQEDEEERIPQSTAASQSDRHVSQSPVAPHRSTRSRTSSQKSPPPAPKLPSPPKAAKPIRRPIHYPGPPSSPTQLVESQRVPLSIIQGLGEVSIQTDSFVVVPASQLEQLASGHRVTLALDHTLPSDVVRLWLFGNGLLRYVACVGPSHADTPGQWTFNVTQMYELNNPLDQPDIEAEEWFNRFPTRWAKLPPVIVSQLLSNLKHALFNTDETQSTTQQQQQPPPPSSSPLPPRAKTPSASFSSASVSQQLEAQLRSETEQHTQCLLALPSGDDDILVPSTPVHSKSKKTPQTVRPPPPPAFTPRLPSSTTKRPSTNKTPRFVQPSQATTASQASADEHHSIPQPSTSRRNTLPPPPTPISRPPPLPESSSLHFVDLDSPENPNVNTGSGDNIPLSQLLTKSQMLSESLLADDVNMPPKIDMWASDEEA